MYLFHISKSLVFTIVSQYLSSIVQITPIGLFMAVCARGEGIISSVVALGSKTKRRALCDWLLLVTVQDSTL